jgi:putative transposase
VRQPWWKGSIERYFRTLNSQLIHTIPGTTFSDPEEKKEYQSTKKAIITQDVLDELLHTWICDVYHNTVHRSILHSPATLWRDLIGSTTQRVPESCAALNVMLGSVETRTIFRYGINLNNLTYASTELHNLFRSKGEIKVKIRWNRSDLGHIYVLDEQSNRYFEVPCTKLSYASGVSLWLHQAIRKEALRLYGEEHQAALDDAKAHLRSICEKAMRSKRQSTRKAAARAEKGLRIGEETQPETPSLEIPMQVEIPEPTGGDSISPVWEDVTNEDIPCFELV